MIKYITFTTIAALAVLLTALIFALPVPDEANSKTKTALLIENVRVVQNGVLSAPQSIHLRDGLIADISPNIQSNAKRIDGTGLTAIPGLIDAHTHSYGTALEDALRFGVTTNVDMLMKDSVWQGCVQELKN